MSELRPIPALMPGMEIPGAFRGSYASVDDVSRKLYEDTLPSIVKIQTDKACGSGFFIDNNGTVATAAHVIDNSSEHFAITSNGRKVRLQLSKVDPKNDVAILTPVEQFHSRALPMAQGYRPVQGDSVYALGHPAGASRTFISPGTVVGEGTPLDCIRLKSADQATWIDNRLKNDPNPERHYVYQRPMIVVGDIRTTHGSSGGPVIDRSGEAIGMSDKGWGTRDFNTPITHVLNLQAAPAQYRFEYERRPSAAIDNYLSFMKERPVFGTTATALATGLGGYGAYKFLDRLPGSGLSATVLGGGLLAYDSYQLMKATDSASRWKHGLAAACDLGMTVGGIVMLETNRRSYGMLGVGLSAVGRLASEFIPNRVVLKNAVTKNDGSSAFPFMRHRYSD